MFSRWIHQVFSSNYDTTFTEIFAVNQNHNLKNFCFQLFLMIFPGMIAKMLYPSKKRFK
jgi:hypothetical protein